MKNAEDVLGIAQELGVDIKTFIDVISVSSGSSFALRSLGREVSVELAPDLQNLMRKDIQHFAVAVRAEGLDPTTVYGRGLACASGLVNAVTLVSVRSDSVPTTCSSNVTISPALAVAGTSCASSSGPVVRPSPMAPRLW
jgi:hypothetical protein